MALLPVLLSGYAERNSDVAGADLAPLLAPTDATLSVKTLPVRASTSRLRVALPTTQTPTPTPEVTPEPTPTPEPLPTMEVRPGDTLVDLAAWFGLTPFDIAATNAVSVDDYLQIGQVLAIPVPAAQFSLPPEATVAGVPDPPPEPEPVVIETPEPTPPPPTAAPYIPPSSDEVVAAICSLPWPCEQMVRIASCESGLHPRSVNPAGYWGLFQISEKIDGWDDALTNATYSYNSKYLPALARGDGLTPWPVCRSY